MSFSGFLQQMFETSLGTEALNILRLERGVGCRRATSLGDLRNAALLELRPDAVAGLGLGRAFAELAKRRRPRPHRLLAEATIMRDDADSLP